MELNINIHETVNGDLFVKELAYQEEQYVTSSAAQFTDNSVMFSASSSITVLKQFTSTTSTIVKAFVHDHSTTDVVNKFSVTTDGWYEIIHLVVPNSVWLAAAIEQDVLSQYKSIYICDNDQLYKYENGALTETDIDILLADEALKSSNIWMTEKDAFVLFNLWQCYLNYCKKMLEGECSQDSKCHGCDDELTKNRNLIWIFLNALQYYVKFGEMQKAQEFLENISGCNSLCSNEMFSKEYDCGCAK